MMTSSDKMTSSKKILRRMHGVMFKLPLMITCDAFEDFILAYLDGELPGKQKFIFEMHLKLCRECREYLDAYRASMTLTKAAFDEELGEKLAAVPDDLVKAVLAARNC